MESPISAVVNHTSCCNLYVLIVTRRLVTLKGPKVSYMILAFRNIPPSVRYIVLKSKIPEYFSASLQIAEEVLRRIFDWIHRQCLYWNYSAVAAWSPKR